MKKHKGAKTIVATLLLCGALTVAQNAYTSSLTPYTKEDIANTKAYVTTLEELQTTEELNFSNQELLSYFNSSLDSPLTLEKARQITKLEIDCELNNPDLSDLKYFTNLQELKITNANIDLKDLEYNQSLKELTIIASKITNTNHLPNSITSLTIFYSTVEDDLLYLPYHLESLSLYQAGFTNIKPKGTEDLFYVHIDSNLCKVDLSFLKDCPKLFDVTIKTCPNIVHPEVLAQLPKLCTVHLDDYAPVWLDHNTLKDIKKLDAEEYLTSEVEYLDKLAFELVPDPNVDDLTKIKAISNYIIKQLNYSVDIIEETDRYDEVSKVLNEYPLRYALNLNDDYEEVCINYACLFQALANRVGLDSTQLMSNGHTWNQIGDNYIDLTSLDGAVFVTEDDKRYSFEELLGIEKDIPDKYYFVKDKTDPSYQEVYHIEEATNIDNNIGYLQPKKHSIYETGMQVSSNLLISICFITLLNIISSAYDYIRYRKLEKEINDKIEKRLLS